ncbi:unnamed protein product [Pelagomonas calceolata]|uniref:Uncharacterized protein n=1 Tax=Pelagomonas calceolata TaxID=35677 RepID=A0A8J2SN95_9STRA|nr:unnamed protein product [Pelagomonas calceolata]|mmetsp:Transcript_2732/g.6174  ORF Transcript_2732/g.6174 Transcript_2732/m.6174 type:complete len:501 (-) Transcript_2732:26-1528(-)
MLERLKTNLNEAKDAVRKRLDRPKDKYERPVRSKLKLVGAAIGVVSTIAFTYHHYDAIVVSNVAFRATKFLDVFIPPAAKDTANEKLINAYMDARWNVIRQRRAKFALWDYCDLRSSLKDAQRPTSWSELVQLRMRKWGNLLDKSKDKRFTIEKDKCVMLQMLETLKLPHPKVRRTWRSIEAASLKSYLLGQEYPAIIKVGHIHQQKSTLYIKDSKELKRNADKYVSWVKTKMDSVFDDGSKTWASVTNKLYAQTSPCLILQDVVNPGKVSAASDGNDMRPTEVLVEVIWGVPLHGVTVVDVVGEMILGKTQHKDTVEFLVRTDGWACYKWPKNRAPGQWFGKWYVNDHSHIRAHRKTQETWFKTKDPSLHDRGWRRTCRGLGSLEYSRCIREYRYVQGLFWAKFSSSLVEHLPKVWDTCSRLAQGVGADYLRCDVFVTGGKVDVNEISLSSYWGNTLSDAWQRRFVDLWIDGYLPADDGGGAAFGTVYSGEIPSPTYAV